tara:strand:+ start:2922 stop:3026 length:105 start_codon:yes stop_codon:yes gene_type:complete
MEIDPAIPETMIIICGDSNIRDSDAVPAVYNVFD